MKIVKNNTKTVHVVGGPAYVFGMRNTAYAPGFIKKFGTKPTDAQDDVWVGDPPDPREQQYHDVLYLMEDTFASAGVDDSNATIVFTGDDGVEEQYDLRSGMEYYAELVAEEEDTSLLSLQESTGEQQSVDSWLYGDSRQYMKQVEEQPRVVTMSIPESNIQEVQKVVDKANRRLKRNGITEEFSFTKTPRTYKDGEGAMRLVYDVTLNTPKISYNGWQFVASVDVLEKGTLVNAVPGVDADEFPRPEEHVCEHCGKKRRRAKTYLLRHENGEIKQIGKSCLEVFLGASPKGLWALTFEDDVKEIGTLARSGGRRDPEVYDPDDVIALSLVVSDGGKKFVPKSVAWDTPSTASLVSEVLNRRYCKNSERRAQLDQLARKAQSIPQSEVQAVRDSVKDIAGNYGENLNIALGEDYIKDSALGVAVSSVGAYWRGKEKAARVQAEKDRNASYAKGFIAPVGEKITGVKATVTTVREFDGYYGPTTMMVAVSEDNHVFKWVSGSMPDEVEPGVTFTMSRATVKDHDNYRGVDQTVVTRAKLEFDEE